MWSRYLNVTDRHTDGQTTCNLITALCVASRGKNTDNKKQQVNVYHVLLYVLIRNWRTLLYAPGRRCVHSPDGGTFLREITSWPPCWTCIKSWFRQSMCVCLKNNHAMAKFHPKKTTDLWAFWRSRPNDDKNNNKMRSISDVEIKTNVKPVFTAMVEVVLTSIPDVVDR